MFADPILFHSGNWFWCAAWIVFKIYLPGMAWSQSAFLHGKNAPEGRVTRWGSRAGATLAVGLGLHLVTVLILAELGIYSFKNELFGTLLWVAAGLLSRMAMSAPLFREHFKENLPGLLLLFVGSIVVVLCSRPSEWLMGGLDPGVYQNQGVAVAQTGTFYPAPEAFYSSLTEDELMLFSRGKGDYREIMPGVPINIQSRSIEHYFFRLTPSLVASMTQSGGIFAAIRVNFFMGLVVLLLFVSFVAVSGGNSAFQGFAALCLVSQPVFLYQLHLPTSEMLQLALVLGVGVLLAFRKAGFLPLVFLALLIFLATANRLSFMPFASFLVFGVAWLDRTREDRKRVLLERVAMLTGLLVGAWFDCTRCAVTMTRLESPMKIMTLVTGAALAVTIVLDVVSSARKMRHFFDVSSPWARRATVSLVLLFVFAAWEFGNDVGLDDAYRTLHSLAPFMGEVCMVIALLGGGVLYWRKRGNLVNVELMAAFMCAATLTISVKTYIHEVYPWAVRRFLVYAVPASALTAGYLLFRVWSQSWIHRNAMRAMATALVLLLLSATAERSVHAWKGAEYVGMMRALQSLRAEIDNDDIVVVDTPTWGTPLKFICGKDIVNGKHLWKSKDPAVMQKGLEALARVGKEQGRQVRFLTTTVDMAMDIYPAKVPGLTLDYESEEVVLEELIQSRSAKDFVLRAKSSLFRLYTWSGQAGSLDDNHNDNKGRD